MSNHNKETEARCFHCYRHYVEGTAAWALYMMRMGHEITNPMYDPRVYHLPEGGMIHVNGVETIAGNQWIDYWCIDIPDGWQLYEEPKPEPPREPEYVIADGSLEWALYQIRSGKKVVKEEGGERYCSSFYKNRLFYLNGYGCLVTKNAIGLIDPCSEKEFLDLDKTGWQLYEPDHDFNVGDWVELTDRTQCCLTKCLNADTGHWLARKADNSEVSVWEEYSTRVITRKLKPSEVVLNFGSSIKGTVRSCEHDGGCVRVISGDRVIAHIMTDVLEQPTRELVERLLKAQEEE